MTKRMAIILGAVAVIVGGIFVAIKLKATGPGKAARPPERLIFAVAAVLDSVPALVAHQQGFFAREGLDVEVKLYPAGKDALAAVRRGEAHFATVADLPIVLATLEGADIQIFANDLQERRGKHYRARKEQRITSPDQRRGKIVVSYRNHREFLLDEFLIMHGIPRTAITIVGLTPGETVDALLSGRVDAVSTWNQYTANLLKKLGDNGLRFFGEETYQMNWNVVATRDFVVEHKDSINKFVKALDRANNYIASNPGGAQKVAMEAFRLDPAQLKEVWTDYEFDLSLDHTLLMTLENQARWAMKQNKTTAREMPNFQSFFYLDALHRINPVAVTVMR